MRISDWSSDVCSSDLGAAGQAEHAGKQPGEIEQSAAARCSAADRRNQRLRGLRGDLVQRGQGHALEAVEAQAAAADRTGQALFEHVEIGRASCRGRWGEVVEISGGAVTLKKKT